MQPSTRLAQLGGRKTDHYRSISMPIYQTAIFEHERPLVEGQDHYNYTRTGNPTRSILEDALTELEMGAGATIFSSGMAAIAAVFKLFKPGDHIVATEGLYGHSFTLLKYVLEPTGLQVNFVDTSCIDTVKAAVKPNTRAIFIETPTNPLLKATDIRAVAEIAKNRDIITVVDSTFMTPLYLRPIELGADLVVHSATKYLAGHNDTLAGAVICRTEELAEQIRLIRTITGATLSPLDAWLTIRGMKTLAVRLERASSNAMAITEFLSQHPAVTAVHYPGLPSHPSHPIMQSQADGFGSVISFNVHSPDAAQTVLNETELIVLAESLGGTETLITYPWSQTHPTVPEDEKQRLGIDQTLLRLAVGIEHADDLITDLTQALNKAQPS